MVKVSNVFVFLLCKMFLESKVLKVLQESLISGPDNNMRQNLTVDFSSSQDPRFDQITIQQNG